MIGALICICLLILVSSIPLILILYMSIKAIKSIPREAWTKKRIRRITRQAEELQAKSVDDALKGFTEAQIRDYIIRRYK